MALASASGHDSAAIAIQVEMQDMQGTWGRMQPDPVAASLAANVSTAALMGGPVQNTSALQARGHGFRRLFGGRPLSREMISMDLRTEEDLEEPSAMTPSIRLEDKEVTPLVHL